MRQLFLVLTFWLSSAVLFAAYPYDSICEIRVKGSGGSATLIAVSEKNALLLTCKHVALRAGNKVKVYWPATGEKSDGRVLKVGRRGFDIAICICPRPKGLLPVPVTGPSRTKSGRVTNAGYPGLDGTLGWQTGKITNISPSQITVTCRPVPGMSGGATFDQRGNLIGIIIKYGRRSGYSTSGTDMLYFVSQFMTSAKTVNVWMVGTRHNTGKIPVALKKTKVVAPADWDEFLVYIWVRYIEPPLRLEFIQDANEESCE